MTVTGTRKSERDKGREETGTGTKADSVDDNDDGDDDGDDGDGGGG